jgi:2-polyprenyl-6-hydroxyphenyl methylase/3-demethylubiquinone-9 3-methyltransferase
MLAHPSGSTTDMPSDSGAERDPANVTFSPTLSSLFEADGTVVRYQQEKYAPILDAIERYFRPRTAPDLELLDVGVGYGAFLRLCEQLGMSRLWGMDPFADSLRIAAHHTRATLREGAIERVPWPFEDQIFDVVTCIDVVEHLHRPRDFFENARGHVRRGGLVVVRTPNAQLPYALRRIPWIGLADPNETHINVHPPRYWRKLARETGYDIIDEWKGEHLTHLRPAWLLASACRRLGIDHRLVPLINAFEQGLVMLLTPRGW